MEGGDGYITLVAGVVSLLVGLAVLSSSPSRGVSVLPIFAGLVAGAIGLINLVDIQERVEEFNTIASDFGAGSIGAGLGAILVGAVMAIVGGAMLRSRLGT